MTDMREPAEAAAPAAARGAALTVAESSSTAIAMPVLQSGGWRQWELWAGFGFAGSRKLDSATALAPDMIVISEAKPAAGRAPAVRSAGIKERVRSMDLRRETGARAGGAANEPSGNAADGRGM